MAEFPISLEANRDPAFRGGALAMIAGVDREALVFLVRHRMWITCQAGSFG
jgi:hypothetical protein